MASEMAGGDVFSFVTFLFVQAKEKLIGVQGLKPRDFAVDAKRQQKRKRNCRTSETSSP
jgi:hypothetical protein